MEARSSLLEKEHLCVGGLEVLVLADKHQKTRNVKHTRVLLKGGDKIPIFQPKGWEWILLMTSQAFLGVSF